MKNVIKYVFLVILTLIFLGFTVYAYIYVHYSDKGNGSVSSYYSDVIFNNIVVKNDNLSVKVIDDKDILSFELPNIIKDTVYSFSVDINNIGNKDIKLSDIIYNNLNSNIDDSLITIDKSLDNEETIKGGEVKNINFDLKYNGDNIEGLYYKMNIKFVFSK